MLRRTSRANKTPHPYSNSRKPAQHNTATESSERYRRMWPCKRRSTLHKTRRGICAALAQKPSRTHRQSQATTILGTTSGIYGSISFLSSRIRRFSIAVHNVIATIYGTYKSHCVHAFAQNKGRPYGRPLIRDTMTRRYAALSSIAAVSALPNEEITFRQPE